MFRTNKQFQKAFTLVELIVVIVILAILATIAFLSFSSQSASARDSTRLSDMNNIAKGLSVFNATAGTYPKPESSLSILASGSIIGYQGFAGSSVLNMIKISNGGKDPLDTSSFYTYSTNSSQSKFQILGLLEDSGNSALSFMPKAFAADYSKRYPITKGDVLGILLGNTGSSINQPVQELYAVNSFTGVDIINSTGSYTAILSKGDTLTGSGNRLMILKTIMTTTLPPRDNSLVGYWDMETVMSDGKLADLSGNGNNGVSMGSIVFGTVDGKLGKSTTFAGTNYVSIQNTSTLNLTSQLTVSAWVKYYQAQSSRVISQCYTNANCGSNTYIIGRAGSTYPYAQINGVQYSINGSTISDNQWYLQTVSYDGNNVNYYLNGIKIYSTSQTGTIPTISGNLTFGANVYPGEYFKGSIDEVRIYNRALSDIEISAIYSAAR